MAPKPVDLSNCDREPIHIPGSIQPHGCLLACDAAIATIARHSENAGEMLGIDGALNGMALQDVLGERALHAMRNAIATATDPARPAILTALAIANGRTFDVSVHQYRSATIVEFESASDGRSIQLVRKMLSRISHIEKMDQLVATTARLVHATLGYDRVMIYRFEQDGAGKVIAEAKRPDLESFLGQYFPATDIPAQARSLYLKNTIRVISDASGARVPLVPELDASGEPLDLSFAHLRSVSPIHCEYLRNMGVAASMSISVIVEGALWGLIACHHYSPRFLPMPMRLAAEMFGEFFSLHLGAIKQKRKLDTARTARASLDRFLRLAAHHHDVEELLQETLPDFAQLVDCDGVALWINGHWTALGATLPESSIRSLLKVVTGVADQRVWATHAVYQHVPEAEVHAAVAAGVLAVPLSQVPKDYLLFFRKELVQTLNWAGNPEKSYTTGVFGERLTPRESFAIWKQTVRCQSQPWTESDREIAEAARAAIVEVVLRHNEMMAEERARADVRQRVLNDELNHRVKNILAVIKSLVGHPVQEGRTLRDYVASLKGRIQALAFAHDQVVRGAGGGSLADLLSAELTPYRSQSRSIVVDGPDAWLDSQAYSVMALVFHEMATNAAKYGSLSRPAGGLSVTWTVEDDGCRIVWQERGGPELRQARTPGFGSALINRSIPYDLGGSSEVEFRREGHLAVFRIPPKFVTVKTAAATTRSEPAVAPSVVADLAARNPGILLVEDQVIIAMDVEQSLADQGITKVVTTGSVRDALAQLDGFTPDAAVLDVNLGQGTSILLAEELTRRGVPFVFATGYGDSAMIPPAFRHVPVVRKPYESEALAAALMQVMNAV